VKLIEYALRYFYNTGEYLQSTV